MTVWAGMVPTATGAPFGTVTANDWVAVRWPSLAVTVTVASPFASPLSVTVDPETDTVTFAVSEEATV